MTLKEALAQLEALGNEKMKEHNIKHGAGKNQFGVKLGDIRTVAKKTKTDHSLALELWKTGNIDARLLALLIVKPGALSGSELTAMVKEEKFIQVADWLYAYVIKEHPDKESLRIAWLTSGHTMALRAAWSLTSGRVAREPEGLDIKAILDEIESDMPQAAPEVQWTMNSTLANIGIHFPEFRKRAIDIGDKLGIYRDYPVSKGCTSPFAPIWIGEMVRRNEQTA